MNVNIKKKIIILILLLLANLLIGLKLVDNKKELMAKRLELDLANRDLFLLEQLSRENAEYKSQVDSALSTLPQSYSDVALLAYKLETVARSLNLNSEISFDRAAKEEDKVDVLGLKIVTTGGYQDYKNFLSSLSNLPYNTSVESSSFESDNAALSQTTVINIYLRKN